LHPLLSRRAAGVLLHPSSLPGPGPIGDLGDGAFAFIDWLASAGQKLWQVLPLGPTGYGNSPYAPFSSFAGNPLLVSLERLEERGGSSGFSVSSPPLSAPDSVDYAAAAARKHPALVAAARRFLATSRNARREAAESFFTREAWWLDDYALFMAAKEHFQPSADARGITGTWNTAWDRDLGHREPAALERWRTGLAHEIATHKVIQFFFREQWLALRSYANQRGIRIIGDLPIFVAGDSADVWANRELFLLNRDGSPQFVAGVPPDAFDPESGQFWGNPQYDWAAMEAAGFAWWVRRFRSLLELVDIIRVDHFRGFSESWFIPAGASRVVEGEWVEVPGAELFATLRRELGPLPVIAEDLGDIDEAVDQLREQAGFPGMRVLQFAFGEQKPNDRSRLYLPENHIPDCVVYTGTHDNDTLTGWWASLDPPAQARVATSLGKPLAEVAIPADLIDLALSSVANTVIIPLQDHLALDSPARMNRPGQPAGNWIWRLKPDAIGQSMAAPLDELCRRYGR
jgi:4-alpha-glucanotransferase